MRNKHSLTPPFDPREFQRPLLAWYDNARRDLPWRAKSGAKSDPYRVWLSEIMLQQTTVKAVIPYFEKFVERWPTVQDLGAASRDDVLAAWAGLGYYSRARNLHACAQALSKTGFPEDEPGLRQLPGIGAYTAGAIAAIAFGKPVAAVDGNVERVLSRICAVEETFPAAKIAVRAAAKQLVPADRAGDYAQALMDLGATVCTPRSPSCLLCPLKTLCEGARQGSPSRYPLKAPKVTRPARRGEAFVVAACIGGETCILLRRRPDKGLLGGMMEIPSRGWENQDGVSDLGDNISWIEAHPVTHTFTHFHLELRVFASALADPSLIGPGDPLLWAPVSALKSFALPSVFSKAVKAGLEALGGEGSSAQALGSAAKSASSVSRVDRSARPSTPSRRK